jgi:hypothetical protein
MHVSNIIDVRKLIVLIIIMMKIRGYQLAKILSFYQKIEEVHLVNLILI